MDLSTEPKNTDKIECITQQKPSKLPGNCMQPEAIAFKTELGEKQQIETNDDYDTVQMETNMLISQKSLSTSESIIEPYLDVVVKYEYEESEVRNDNIQPNLPYVKITSPVDVALDEHVEKQKNVSETTAENKCMLCNEQFSNCEYLKEHLKTHVGEAPFDCLLCDKTFCRKDRLQV